MAYEAKKVWTDFYAARREPSKTYPSEGAVRIFLGKYPELKLDKASYKDQRACDAGCGDGRNLVLLHDLGFECYGVEISEEICRQTKSRLEKVERIHADVRVGTNAELPFDNEFLHYLLSWHACYYMGEHRDFGLYVTEFARVLRPDGYLIVCAPKPNHFFYGRCETLRPGYVRIQNDPFTFRNGAVMRMFRDAEDIKQQFGTHFDRFVFGGQDCRYFGLEEHFFLFVCQKISA